MALAPEKLRILTFPQRIEGRELDLNVLLLPTQSLLNDLVMYPGAAVELPRFIGATLELKVDAIRGVATYPFSNPALLAADDATLETFDTDAQFPAALPALYAGLASQFTMPDKGRSFKGGRAPASNDDGIRKYLPRSYRNAFNFTTPRTRFAVTDDSYHCAIKRSSQINPAFKPSSNDVSWGQVIALCLRQPQLAERIGLLHRVHITLSADGYFAEGGWLACKLTSSAADFGIVDPANELRSYAARVPPIDRPRQLFAAVLFPYVEGPSAPAGNFDKLKIEAADYDDGFAKIVHATQPVSANLLSEEPDGIHVQKDVGVRLGWDDEQLLIWQNRQLLEDADIPGGGKRIDAPLGVFFHRVDVREKGQAEWGSLVRIRNKAALTLAGQAVAAALTESETGVQVFPSSINGSIDARLWLPSYFTQWYGASLVLPDGRAAQLDVTGALADPGKYSDANIKSNLGQGGNLYEPLLPENCELKYGHEYQFRVRLADMTGGGPAVDDDALNDAPAPSSELVFRRFVAPKQLTVIPDEAQDDPDAASTQFYAGNSFTVRRPRLGYPALLFTQLDTHDAFQKLLDDMTFLHTGKTGDEKIKEQRAVSYYDPDVDQILVVVDVRTLALDTQASENKREPFIRLYSTVRRFDANPETPLTLTLDYRDANVIDFGNRIDLGDLGISQEQIDQSDALVLPTSRDLRITLYPVCSSKPALPEYFGFGKTRVDDELYLAGELVQFFVREDAADERDFFTPGLESHELQALFLQPDPPQVNNPVSIVASVVEGSEVRQSTLMERLAAQLDVDFKGLTLIGKPGQRIQFGCSSRIRHTLAPDNSSLTFATPGDLLNHWLCVLKFDVQRDWTWDGLAQSGIEVRRSRKFTAEPAGPLEEVVGYVDLKKTASRVATTGANRSATRVLFIDAVEPKKDRAAAETALRPFPDTIDVSYVVKPKFIDSVSDDAAEREARTRSVVLPVTTVPAQVPKIVGAGYALSPYTRNHEYSETAVRERYLWLEFDAPIEDPNDAYFARVLAYSPDPLLSFPNPDQLLVRQDDPPLGIDPELIRVITHGQGNDNAGLDAMQPLIAETAPPATPLVKITPVHYLLPLPPGLHAESPELFGFFTYEFRVGHTNRLWCTAQGRFGHPARLSGVQHPAPALQVLVNRTPKGLSVTAPHATAVFEGRNVTSRPPRTEIWCMLYAQVLQADAAQHRNVLLAEARLDIPEKQRDDAAAFLARRQWLAPKDFNSFARNLDEPMNGVHAWSEDEIREMLERFHLDEDTPLSVLAVEMMPRYDRFVVLGEPPDMSVRPLSTQLGQYRILRTSPLVAAPEVCCVDC